MVHPYHKSLPNWFIIMEIFFYTKIGNDDLGIHTSEHFLYQESQGKKNNTPK